VSPTAADYAWFESEFPDLADAYCIALIRGILPDEVLHRLGASPEMTTHGIEAAYESAFQAIGRYEGFLALTRIGDWTLSVEPNGFACSLDAVAATLAHDTTLVSHYLNVNFVSRFLWIESDNIKLSFELLWSRTRTGTEANRVVDLITDAGFVFSEDAKADDGAVIEASFALAEILTGVRVTPDLLRSATFTCGIVQIPR
jgi:uncharacterized protein DUF6461